MCEPKKAAEVQNSQGPIRNPGSYLQSSREPQSRWKKWLRKKETERGELGQERTALKYYFLRLQEFGQESRPTGFYLSFPRSILTFQMTNQKSLQLTKLSKVNKSASQKLFSIN